MSKTVRQMILTETALAVVITLVSLMVAQGSIEVLRASAAFLVALRAFCGVLPIVIKNAYGLCRRNKQIKLLPVAQG